MTSQQPPDNNKCDECDSPHGVWYDDDGVIRCEKCHADVALAWGGDYDVLVKKYSKNYPKKNNDIKK